MNDHPIHHTPDILVVDDVPDNLRLMAAMLKQSGYKVRAVPSGEWALKAARTLPPDLILLDINMPDMNGYQVCEQIRADEVLADIPIIYLSAMHETEDKVRALRGGGNDYITKPFQAEEVTARISVHLELRRLRKELQNQNEILEEKVCQRTEELALANRRLRELGSLKNDFRNMISHEIRTPANGILNIGEILLDENPASELNLLFHDSSKRLRDLIDDATMIAEMDEQSPTETSTSLDSILDDVSKCGAQITMAPGLVATSAVVRADRALFTKALTTMVNLAAFFCREIPTLLTDEFKSQNLLSLRINLDSLPLTPDQTDDFFRLESPTRCASSAESLGLAPVVAEKILKSFGGSLRLVKEEGKNGYLEAIVPATWAEM